MRRKIRFVALLLSVVMLMTVAMIGTAAAEEKNKITWATWCVSEEALKPTYMAIANTYMEQHPDVEIEVVTWPYAQYKDQLIISAAADNAPDIAHVKKEWLPELLEMGVLRDLTNVITDEVKNDYIPSILEAATVDGKVMSAPWFNNDYALYYNKTLMAKAGIETVPTTWSELIEDIKKISALGSDEFGNKIYGYACLSSKNEVGTGYNFLPHMWAYGGNLLDENGNVIIDSPENLAAFTEMADLFLSGDCPNGLSAIDIRNLFAQGIVGFYYDLEMAAGVFDNASPKGSDFRDEYGVMCIPAADGPDGAGYIIEHHLAVFNTADEDDVLSDFITYMTGDTVLQILYDGGMGKLPDRISVLNNDTFTNPDNPMTKVFIDSLNSAKSLPNNKAAFMLCDEKFQDALAKLAVGTDPAQVVKELDADCKALYGQ